MALGSLRKFEADEYVMIATLLFFTVLIAAINIVESTSSNLLPPGYDVEHMTQADITERTLGSKLVLVVEQMQLVTIWLIKACLLIMYKRMTVFLPQHKIVLVTAVYTGLTFVCISTHDHRTSR